MRVDKGQPNIKLWSKGSSLMTVLQTRYQGHVPQSRKYLCDTKIFRRQWGRCERSPHLPQRGAGDLTELRQCRHHSYWTQPGNGPLCPEGDYEQLSPMSFFQTWSRIIRSHLACESLDVCLHTADFLITEHVGGGGTEIYWSIGLITMPLGGRTFNIWTYISATYPIWCL